MNLLPSEVEAYCDHFFQNFSYTNQQKIIFCPPFVSLGFFQKFLEKNANSCVSLGAQNCSEYDHWAHTGEISAAMLADIGAEFVIVAHSERRQNGENPEQIAEKIVKIIQNSLTPILCVGESEYYENIASISEIIDIQIREIFEKIPLWFREKIIIAYEPVWAIGSGKTPNPEKIWKLFENLKKNYKNPFCYGGSVNLETIWDFAKIDVIDGFLIGSACLNAQNFAKICGK